MRKTFAIVFAVMLFAVACTNRSQKYAYVEINKTQGCVILHLDKHCNNSHMTLMPMSEVYLTARSKNGSWLIRYNGERDFPMRYCAKCISDEAMEALIDSIAEYDKKDYDAMVEDLIEELSVIRDMKMNSATPTDF